MEFDKTSDITIFNQLLESHFILEKNVYLRINLSPFEYRIGSTIYKYTKIHMHAMHVCNYGTYFDVLATTTAAAVAQ